MTNIIDNQNEQAEKNPFSSNW